MHSKNEFALFFHVPYNELKMQNLVGIAHQLLQMQFGVVQ